jgi:hypothetical protein
MCRKFLCGLAALLVARGLSAQPVPARELWEFPLGAVLEPAALAAEPGAGLWNPAAGVLSAGTRWRFGVASLATATDQGVDGQLVGASWRRSSGTTLGLSVARAGISGIVRTDTDPQGLGDVPYSTTLVSLSASRELLPHLAGGLAARWRRGQIEQQTRDAIAADLGFVLHDLPFRNARVAASSFLWRPGREIEDRPAFVAAADLRVLGDSARELRAGYSHNGVNRGTRERGVYLGSRLDRLEARAAYLRTESSGRSATRLRSGLALHYNRFVVGVAREEGASGLGPLYQFTLSSILR